LEEWKEGLVNKETKHITYQSWQELRKEHIDNKASRVWESFDYIENVKFNFRKKLL